MKLILKQDVPNLGTLGDIVDVKPGYARNYLLPRGMALPATSQESKEFRHHMQYLTKQRQQEVDRARQRAALMKVLELEITRKAGPGGRLFGSVTNRDIQALLEEAGYSLERRSIPLAWPDSQCRHSPLHGPHPHGSLSGIDAQSHCRVRP